MRNLFFIFLIFDTCEELSIIMNLFNSDDNDDDGKYRYNECYYHHYYRIRIQLKKMSIIYNRYNFYDYDECYLDEDYMVDLNYDSDAKDSVNSDLELGTFMLFLYNV